MAERGRFRFSVQFGQGSKKSSHSPEQPNPNRRRKGLIVAAAVLVPLLLVGAAWGGGYVRFPTLERITGFTPSVAQNSAANDSTSGDANGTLTVFAPLDAAALTGTVPFEGHATPNGRVYFWNQGENVPVVIQADAAGHWLYAFDSHSLTLGQHVLQFAAQDGHRWSNTVTRTVTLKLAAGEPVPSFTPPVLSGLTSVANFLPAPIGVPLLTVFRPAAALIDSVTLRVTSAGPNPITGAGADGTKFQQSVLQDDITHSGVPDAIKSSPVPPTVLLPNPVIQTPVWLNLILLVAVLVLPVVIVVVRNPDWFGSWIKLRTIVGARERVDKQRIAVERSTREAQSRFAHDKLQARERVAKQRLAFAQQRLATVKEVREYEAGSRTAAITGVANARAAAIAARANAKANAVNAVKSAERDVAALRVREAEFLSKKQGSTYIDVRPGSGRFRTKPSKKKQRGD